MHKFLDLERQIFFPWNRTATALHTFHSKRTLEKFKTDDN